MTGTDVEKIPAPRENADLFGHEEAEAALLRAALSGRMPHAWLIGGPAGVGKATLAYRFARFMLSGAAERGGGLFGELPSSLHLDTEDPTFRHVASGGHHDLLMLERRWNDKKERLDTELRVDEVRRVPSFLSMTPMEGGWRVVVLDEAERMNRSSANAILKSLEEPPPRALILVVTSAPGAVLPTIRSRCRRLILRPLAEQVVAAFLARHFPEMSDADRIALARLADGSIGRATILARDGGLDLYRALIDLLDTLPRLDLPALHRLGDRLAPVAAEPAYRTATDLLVWWLARLVRSIGAGVPPPEVLPGEAALIGRLTGARSLDRWLEVWDKIRTLFYRADAANLDRKQIVLQAFLSLEAAARS